MFIRTLAQKIANNFNYNLLQVSIDDNADTILQNISKFSNKEEAIVIDGNFPSHLLRQTLIASSKRLDVPCKCIHLTTPIEIAKHLNAFRNVSIFSKLEYFPITNSKYKLL